MLGKRVVFTGPNRVELESFDFDTSDLQPEEVAIRSSYTLISPGTELPCLRGTESWAQPPFIPGYASCGTVVGVGSAVTAWQAGDPVFSYTHHASHVKTDVLMMPVPVGLDPKLVPFARMACVAITALRVSNAELGDHVLVWGLGLIGNLAAQLFALAGCEVIGADVCARRLEVAKECGVRHVIDASGEDVVGAVRRITGGNMCETVVEATGIPRIAVEAARAAGKQGEVILLGSPRGEHSTNVTELLDRIHVWGNGCVTYKGAHEWRYPIHRDPGGHVKHSIPRNAEIILRLMADGRLRVPALLTHIIPPAQVESAYIGLRDKRDEYLGVILDWTQT